MGILTKTKEIRCPECGLQGTVEYSRFGSGTLSKKCPGCGTHLTVLSLGVDCGLLAGHSPSDMKPTLTMSPMSTKSSPTLMSGKSKMALSVKKDHR